MAGKILIRKEGIDMIAREFLSQIFQSDPTMRPTIDKLKKHPMFMQVKPADYWQQIAAKTF